MPKRAAAALSLLLLAPSSLTAQPATASCDAPVALRFAPGAHTGEASGGIARGTLACWTIAAKAGQSMVATIDSAAHNAVMQIYAPGWTVSKSDGDYRFAGKPLTHAAEGDDATTWTGPLPASGKFLFVLGTTNGGGDYALHVSITAAH